MKRIRLSILTSLTYIILTNCNNDEKIKGLRANEILAVTLDISDDIDVKQITLTSTNGSVKILGNQINNKRKVKLKTPQHGEGTYSICVYTATDTLCSQESYIEGGYRPKIRLKNNKFETLKWL